MPECYLWHQQHGDVKPRWHQCSLKVPECILEPLASRQIRLCQFPVPAPLIITLYIPPDGKDWSHDKVTRQNPKPCYKWSSSIKWPTVPKATNKYSGYNRISFIQLYISIIYHHHWSWLSSITRHEENRNGHTREVPGMCPGLLC